MAKSNVNGSKIPPGQLVNLIQKGIMYTELEKSVSDEGVDSSATAPFEHLQDSSKGSSSKSRESSKGGGGPSSMDVDEPQGGSSDTTLTDDQVETFAFKEETIEASEFQLQQLFARLSGSSAQPLQGRPP